MFFPIKAGFFRMCTPVEQKVKTLLYEHVDELLVSKKVTVLLLIHGSFLQIQSGFVAGHHR